MCPLITRRRPVYCCSASRCGRARLAIPPRYRTISAPFIDGCPGDRCAPTKKPALPPAFVSLLEAAKLVRGFQCGLFLPGDGALHGRLHLLESANLDLAHAFARHIELGSEVFQGHRLFRQTPRLEDAAFARVEHADGPVPRLPAMIDLLVLGHDGLLVG